MTPAPLPAGTVTFLLADVEGSTRLLQRLGPDDYASVLEDQENLLESTLAARGGLKVDTCGDSSLFVFTGARDALAASLAAQLALHGHRWPRGVDVRVRMGLHTGEARRIGDRYVSLALHKVDRITARAHGGQVAVSDFTCRLVAPDLPTGVTLADLGEHPLKDFDDPEHVFRLCHPDLPPGPRQVREPAVGHQELRSKRGAGAGAGRRGLRRPVRVPASIPGLGALGRATRTGAASRAGQLRRLVWRFP